MTIRVASTPVTDGHFESIVTIAGRRAIAIVNPSSPLSAWPTTVNAGSLSIRCCSMIATVGSSSTISTRTGSGAATASKPYREAPAS